MKKNKIMSIWLFAILSLSIISFIPSQHAYAQTTTYYSLTSSDAAYALNANTIFAGQRVFTNSSIINNVEINTIELRMAKNGNPSGDFLIGVWNSTITPTSSNYKYLIGNETANTFIESGGAQFYTFNNLNTSYILQVDDIIGVFYDDGTATNNISVSRDANGFSPNISHIDGGNSCDAIFISGSWTTAGECDEGSQRSDLTAVIAFFVSNEVAGVDCELPENEGILICRLTSTTGGNIGGLGGILDTGLFNLFTNSGLIDGEDTDPATNGVGYFITIAGFGVMTAMFFIATKGRLNDVPTFVWMLSAIALLGAITAIGWLEPTFLILGIIAIIALSAMQVRNSIDRGLDFGGRGDF